MSLRRFLLLTVSYLFIAIIFTWPLVTQLTTHGFGADEDSPYHLWHNWWLNFSLFHLKTNPLYTNYIFHPQKIPLIFDANSFVFAALTLPLQGLTNNVILASNIVFLLSFVLSGLSMFALASFVLRKIPLPTSRFPLPAFLAGLIFAFSPYTFAQALDGHTNLTTTWIIPLYTLFLLKSLEGATLSDKVAPLKTLLLASLLATAQLYSDFTYTAFLILLTGLILAWHLHQKIKTRPPSSYLYIFISLSLQLLPLAATAAILASPLLIEVVKLQQMGFRASSPLWVQNIWAADLAAFFLPGNISTFLQRFSYTAPRGTVEGTQYLGWTVLFLTGVALFSWRRQRVILARPESDSGVASAPQNDVARNLNINLFIFLTLSFFTLSLGPFLNLFGNYQFSILNFKFIIPLPWILLHKIPLVGEVQETARLNPFLMMSLAALAAYGLAQLAQLIKNRFILHTSYFILFISLLLEFFPAPFPTTQLTPPPIYQQVAKDPGQFSVLTLPLGFNSGQVALGLSPIGSLQFYQVYHQKPSFRGTVARLPSWAFDYYRQLPLIKYLLDPRGLPDPEDTEPALVQKTFKEQLHIKYVVIHKDKYGKLPIVESEKLIQEVLGAKKIYEEGALVAYQI